MVKMGTTLVLGPRKRTMETFPAVVGAQVMVKGLPTGTCWARPGAEIALPDGSFVVSAVYSAEATAARADRTETTENFILANFCFSFALERMWNMILSLARLLRIERVWGK
jgi:hypothetical protein